MEKRKDLFELYTEVEGIAMIIAGLGNQLDNMRTSTLSPEAMEDALYGVQSYLKRIADDMCRLQGAADGKGDAPCNA